MEAASQVPATNATPQKQGHNSAQIAARKSNNTFIRVARYMGVRLVTLFITVLIGVFLTIMIANMGGYVDKIRLGDIQETVALSINQNPAYRGMTPEDRQRLIVEQIHLRAEVQGLNKPFMLRTVDYMWNAMTLNLGQALKMTSDSGSKQVRLIILERLPATLVLFGSVSLILFFVELFLALALSRRYGSFFDKLVVALSPTSSAPPWFYGIFLILIFASIFKVLPFGGMVDAPPPDDKLLYILSLLKHMALPALAWALSQSFLAIYTWRTFFLIYSSEDYVEMAKAKGLSARTIERDYVLLPTLPTIITGFALIMINTWTGATVTETVFEWPGLGRALYQAVQFYDTPVIVANVVINAYLLVTTVFILDFIYVLIDPRVKLGGQGGSQA